MSEDINLLLDRVASTPPVELNALRSQLVKHINEMLNNDFSSLVQLLYRVDVDEQKLTWLLSANPDMDAAILISDLIISRQEEKVKTRKLYKADDQQNEEKW